MAGKSKRKRSKQSSTRKARAQQHVKAITQAPAAYPVSETAPQPDAISAPAAIPLDPPTKTQTIQFPHISTELRTIGVLAGIMLIVLIVLYFILV